MLIGYKRGQTSVVLRVKLLDSSVATGAGLTGLTNASSGLIISTIADNESSATAYTVGGSNVETITTLGTYAAPTSGKCRFKEVDSTNHKGIYEIQIADARFAVSSAKSLLVSIAGATNLAQCDVVVPLRDLDPYDSVRAGLTAIPNVAFGATGGLSSYVIRGGTMQTGSTSTTAKLDSSASATDDLYNGCILHVVSGTGAGQSRVIKDYVGSTKVATVDTWATTPDNTSVFIVCPFGAVPASTDSNFAVTTGTLSAAAVQSIWDALTSALTTSNSIGKRIVDNLNVVLGTVLGSPAGASISADIAAIFADGPGRITKNVALAAFPFVMRDSTNHAPVTGKTVTATRSLDGAAFGSCANSVAEVANGVYKIDLATTDTNANTITYRFTASGCDDTLITVITQVT